MMKLKDQLRRKFKAGMYGMYYLINKKSRVSQHNYFFSNPKFEIAKNLFSLLEKDYVAKVYNIQMPQMKIHQVLFIPKTESNFPKILQGKGENLNEDDGDDIPYQNTAFHCNKKIYDPETHVKVRLMINSDFKHYDFENGKHYGRSDQEFELGSFSIKKLFNEYISK